MRSIRTTRACRYSPCPRRAGSWYWQEKRDWPDDRWREYAEAPGLHTFAASYAGEPAGYFELRHDPHGGIEIVYFGLLAAFIGKGLGGAMLGRALQHAWALGPERVWVHTCTLDHPAAVAFYQRSGFCPFRRQVEIADDPRLVGTLRRDAAKHVPIME